MLWASHGLLSVCVVASWCTVYVLLKQLGIYSVCCYNILTGFLFGSPVSGILILGLSIPPLQYAVPVIKNKNKKRMKLVHVALFPGLLQVIKNSVR